MGKVRFGIPEELALRLKNKFDLRYFVETGTYKAGTSTWASGFFDHVWTIEGWEQYYLNASQAHVNNKKISFIFGDSRVRLPEVLSQLDTPALVWLDAHWIGNSVMSAGTSGECPLHEEIIALMATPVRHFILIDDARCFCGDLPRESDPKLWPQLNDIRNWLKGYYIVVHEDVIICVPPEARPVVDEYILRPGISVLTLTSNDYVHMLSPFAYLFNKYWNDKQHVTALRYDKRPPYLPANFYAPAAGNQDKLTFSDGLRRWLELNYPSEVFIMMLEDYWLTERVNVSAINTLVDYMTHNPQVAKIDLSGDRMKFDHIDYPSVGNIEMIRSTDDAPYQFSLQAALWRRDFLLRFIDHRETPWQFEQGGTNRIIHERKQGKFDGLILGTKTPLLKYVNACGGEGRKPGEYDHKKISPVLWNELKEKALV